MLLGSERGKPAGTPDSRRALLVAQAPGHARLQRPQLDEARRGALREQAAGLREGGQAGVVDGVGRGARDHARVALVQLDPDRPGDALVDLLHIGVEIAAKWLPPQARIDQIGPLVVELGLELVLVCLLYTSPSPRDGLLSR